MLDSAGVEYRAVPSNIDETAIKKRLDEPGAIASELARAKAVEVSASNPDDWVVGSDSVASIEGRTFDKSGSRDEAADHLRFFSGKTLRLTSAVALVREGRVDWEQCETAELQVRPLSEEFIEAYLDVEWPEVGYCVGVFRLEGRGVQLFSSINGSYFTILGMPLIPLFGALRERGLIQS